jgi:hypothetical protein
VNPNGLATSVRFEYGTTTAYGSTTARRPSARERGRSHRDRGHRPQPGTTYHARVVATSSAGTTNGGDVTFTTAGPEARPRSRSHRPPLRSSRATRASATSRSRPRSRRRARRPSPLSGRPRTAPRLPPPTTRRHAHAHLRAGRRLGDDHRPRRRRRPGRKRRDVHVALSAPVNASLGPATSTITITDDDRSRT